MKTDQLLRTKELYTKNIKGSAKLLGKTAELMEKNPNVGVELGMYDAGATLFPPFCFNEKAGTVHATIFIIDSDGAEIYLPDTNCRISVAYLSASSESEPEVTLKRLNPHLENNPCDRIRQYEGPVRMGTVSAKRVAEIFAQVQKDVRETFDLYQG